MDEEHIIDDTYLCCKCGQYVFDMSEECPAAGLYARAEEMTWEDVVTVWSNGR